jgi:hypothetical protein
MYTVMFYVTKSCFIISNHFTVLEFLFTYYFTVSRGYKLSLCYTQQVNRSTFYAVSQGVSVFQGNHLSEYGQLSVK